MAYLWTPGALPAGGGRLSHGTKKQKQSDVMNELEQSKTLPEFLLPQSCWAVLPPPPP
jgi:hypothetical protein